MLNELGANEITIKDIEAFLSDDGADTPPADDKTETPAETQPAKNEETKAFANRLKEATSKARQEERENIAKGLGYESFEAMQKAKENKLFEEKGLDPDEVAPVVEEIVKKRLSEDPRLKELEEFKQKKIEEWAKKELAEITTLTGGKVTKMDQIPKNVIDLWKEKGSLKAAYLTLEGERLIREMQTGIAGGQSKGSTGHLNSPQGNPPPAQNGNKRPFTQKEKEIYKMFNPHVTNEELNKMLKEN